MDIADRMGKSVLGINVQYLKQSEIVVRTRGMVEINCKHTGHNLKDMIIVVLNRCGLDIQNVYSCTTDNGANMIKLQSFFHWGRNCLWGRGRCYRTLLYDTHWIGFQTWHHENKFKKRYASVSGKLLLNVGSWLIFNLNTTFFINQAGTKLFCYWPFPVTRTSRIRLNNDSVTNLS